MQMANDEVSWQTAFWCVLAFALNTMSQSSGRTLGFSSRHSFYTKSSPVICPGHIWTTIGEVVSFVVSNQSVSEGLEAWKHSHFESVPLDNARSSETLRENNIIKIVLFVLGALLPGMKLFGCTGVPWAQAVGSIYLTCFVLDEALYQICTRTEPKGRSLRPSRTLLSKSAGVWTTVALDLNVMSILLLQGLMGSNISVRAEVFTLTCFFTLLFSFMFGLSVFNEPDSRFLDLPMCFLLGPGVWHFETRGILLFWGIQERIYRLGTPGWILGLLVACLYAVGSVVPIIVVWVIVIVMAGRLFRNDSANNFVRRLESWELYYARVHGGCWLLIGILLFARVYSPEHTHDPRWLHVFG